MKNNYFLVIIPFLILSSCGINKEIEDSGISIYDENPFYWEYNNKPRLLIGGSSDDNLFQIADIKEHLELLHSVGGNYIRCTMSSRDEGNIKPYKKNSEGLFNLDSINPFFWDKFETLLLTAQNLKIIVQLELWATYDFYWGKNNWANNVFNPRINVNYTSDESGLPDSINHPAQTAVNPFFKSVPELDNNKLLLEYQERFIDKILAISFKYDNVLYCIDNETLANYKWGKYWAAYLHDAADKKNREIYVTEMWDYWDPSHGQIEGAVIQEPDLGDWFAEYTNTTLHDSAQFKFSLQDTLSYQFLDISNNNAQKGEVHYNTALWIRNAVLNSGNLRPINNVKVYGGDIDQIWAGTRKDGQERFWRNIFAGHASTRFHRPAAGIGLNKVAQNNIKSMRMITDSIDIFKFVPSNSLISNRQINEAYAMTNEKNEFFLYFPSSAEVVLNVEKGSYEINWLSISESAWLKSDTVSLPGKIVAPKYGASAAISRKLNY